ncbi:hypothetical protein OS31_19370 [Dickeya oryzae]
MWLVHVNPRDCVAMVLYCYSYCTAMVMSLAPDEPYGPGGNNKTYLTSTDGFSERFICLWLDAGGMTQR